MVYKVLKTAIFEKKFAKLAPNIQKEVEEIKDKLKENPFVGKPLRYDFFREKKLGKFRIYYLIYEQYLILYLITISEKNDQQVAINTVLTFLDSYKKEVEEWMEKNKV